MKDVILNFIKRNDHASMVELQGIVGDSSEGSMCIHWPGDENLILWTGMSESFVNAIDDLHKEDNS